MFIAYEMMFQGILEYDKIVDSLIQLWQCSRCSISLTIRCVTEYDNVLQVRQQITIGDGD